VYNWFFGFYPATLPKADVSTEDEYKCEELFHDKGVKKADTT
jgi:hypothetical protein